jgi:cold shock CspA family protein
MTGTVKTVTDKNYGFIIGDDGKEYFFHRADFNGHWEDLYSDHRNNKKARVEFDVAQSTKGHRASNVSIKPQM